MEKPKIYCELFDEKHKCTLMEYIDCRGNCWQVTCPVCKKMVAVLLRGE